MRACRWSRHRPPRRARSPKAAARPLRAARGAGRRTRPRARRRRARAPGRPIPLAATRGRGSGGKGFSFAAWKSTPVSCVVDSRHRRAPRCGLLQGHRSPGAQYSRAGFPLIVAVPRHRAARMGVCGSSAAPGESPLADPHRRATQRHRASHVETGQNLRDPRSILPPSPLPVPPSPLSKAEKAVAQAASSPARSVHAPLLPLLSVESDPAPGHSPIRRHAQRHSTHHDAQPDHPQPLSGCSTFPHRG